MTEQGDAFSEMRLGIFQRSERRGLKALSLG